MELFAFCQSDFHFGVAMRQEDFGWDAGVTLLRNLGSKFLDLLFVKQKLTVTKVINIKNVALLIRGDVHIADKSLSVLHEDVGVADGRVLRSEAFDLSPAVMKSLKKYSK